MTAAETDESEARYPMKQIHSGEDEEEFDEMECREKHAKWVGILPSLMTPGAGQFLAGRRKHGILSFIVFFGLAMISWIVRASPIFQGVAFGWSFFVAALGLWVWVLCDSYRPIPKIGFLKWILAIGVCFGVNGVILHVSELIVRPFHIPTHSMEPTIRGDSPADSLQKYRGDTVLVEMFAYWFSKPQRGDLVVFTTEGLRMTHGTHLLKRVAGLPGEKIAIRNGKLLVNGSAITEPRVFTKITYENAYWPGEYLKTPDEEYVVPAGHYFLLADNSGHGADSRFHGPVPEKNIVGKATKISWPPERIGVLE